MAQVNPTPRPSMTSRQVAVYGYTDPAGRLLFQVVRYDPKDFRQRRPDGNEGWIWNLQGVERVLYRLPRILAAVATGQRIYLVEGEKDVHAIEAAGEIATTAPMGANKWLESYSETLAGAEVILVADQDEPGYRKAATVAASLEAHGCKVYPVEAASGNDAADHLKHYTLAELRPLTLPDPEPSRTRGGPRRGTQQGAPAPWWLTRFPKARRAGNGWLDRCTAPGHDDKKPSLSIAIGDDGRGLFCCQSQGCDFFDIIRGAGLTAQDVGPVRVCRSTSRNQNPLGKGAPRAIQETRTRPERNCPRPVGLHLDDGSYLVASCRRKECPGCRAWDEQLVRGQAAALPEQVVMYRVAGSQWDTHSKALRRAGVSYQRLVQDETGSALVVASEATTIPAEPMTREVALNRALPGRLRTSKSADLPSKDEVEARLMGIDTDTKKHEKPVRQLVGFFTPSLFTRATSLITATDVLEAVARECGLRVERNSAAVVIAAARHNPNLELFRRRIGYHELPEAVPWQEGGPIPDEVLLATKPAEPWQRSEEPPLEAYLHELEEIAV